MNPLKFRLSEQGQNNPNALRPRPSELQAWLKAQPTDNIQATAPLLLPLLQEYNRCKMPTAMRLKALILLQPAIDNVLHLLRKHYQSESLPLGDKALSQAQLCLQFLDETSIGYKIVVTDAVIDKNDDNSINVFVAATKLAIDHLGQRVMEYYSQYTPLPEGLWGELHRLYSLAESNDLHKHVLTLEEVKPSRLTTITQAYLRIVLLALTQPNHLMPGQTALIFHYLEKWTTGCSMVEKENPIAEAGDIVIDLAGERPPAMATGHSLFRPVNGRFLDISPLRAQLREAIGVMEGKHIKSLRGGVPPTIVERLQRALLIRLNNVWQGRLEREAERREDGVNQVSVCVGLDAAHHFISQEKSYNPERDEDRIIHPHKDDDAQGLSLVDLNETPWADAVISMTGEGLDKTRLSRFDEKKLDVWTRTDDHEIDSRDEREASRMHAQMGPWLRTNRSTGGMSLKRLPDNQSRLCVGALIAYLDHDSSKIWKLGILRWLQDNHNNDINIGIMTLSHVGIPTAVRAVGGTGNGSEYFRSLMVNSVLSEGTKPGLLVPANIYDIGTQLVLNYKTELKYVLLTNIAETTSSFSLFEFKDIEIPPEEQEKIEALGKT